MIVPFKKENKKYIFIDYKTRYRVFENLEFDDIEPFENNYSIVELNNKCGVVDLNGNIAIPVIYDDVLNFSEGYALISINQKLGIVRLENGQLVIPPVYNNLFNVSEGLILFSEDEDIHKEFCTSFVIEYGFLNLKNEIQIKPKYTPANSFSDGLALVGKHIGWDDDYNLIFKYGFIDKNENLVIDYKYDSANSFKDGIAEVCIENKIFCINKFGEIVQNNNLPHTGLIKFIENDSYGFKDINGIVIIPAKFKKPKYPISDWYWEKFSNFNEGRAGFYNPVQTRFGVDEKYGYINEKGDIIIKPYFTSAGIFKNGLARVCIDNDGFYIDLNGEELYERTIYYG